MGLFTSYYASTFAQRITILEKSTVGDKKTASFSYTRSIRNDYLDPVYARLAYEARRLWLEFQRNASEPCLIECGCLNIAKARVTPDLDKTYAVQSFATLRDLGLLAEEFDQQTLAQRFPQFSADLGRLDVQAGLMYVPAVTQTMVAALRQRQVHVVEHATIQGIAQQGSDLVIRTSDGEYRSKKLVITAGLGTNEILHQIAGCTTQFPLSPDRPSQCKYFIPSAQQWPQFTSQSLPVFAYLDVGIYGHPIYADKTPGVKIGFYNPPDVQTASTHIHDVESFVEECLPGLRGAQAVDVQDVDQCFYDLVADDNFILGQLPGFPAISVGVGWRGTGYKYAPWIGQTLMQLAIQNGTVYDIARFTPQRFA